MLGSEQLVPTPSAARRGPCALPETFGNEFQVICWLCHPDEPRRVHQAWKPNRRRTSNLHALRHAARAVAARRSMAVSNVTA